MASRSVVRKAKHGFNFVKSEVFGYKDLSADEALSEAKGISERTRFEALEGKRINNLAIFEREGLQFSDGGFVTMCQRLKLPTAHMKELSKYRPELAAEVINNFIARKGKNNILAISGNTVEGVVSKNYSRLNNYKIVESVIDSLNVDKLKGLSFEGLKMRINHLDDYVDMGTARRDDVHGLGIDIYNGEDGKNAFLISNYILRLICTNGMVGRSAQSSNRIIHRGFNLHETAIRYMQKAGEINSKYVQGLKNSQEIFLNEDELYELLAGIRSNLSLKVSNSTMDKVRETVTDIDEPISLYNLVNGLTYQAHNVKGMENSRKIEMYASKMLDKGMGLIAA